MNLHYIINTINTFLTASSPRMETIFPSLKKGWGSMGAQKPTNEISRKLLAEILRTRAEFVEHFPTPYVDKKIAAEMVQLLEEFVQGVPIAGILRRRDRQQN